MSIRQQSVSYRDDDGTALTGVLHLPEVPAGERSGILLIHGGAGLDDHANDQSRRYAALGYVVFACDMYGDGVPGDRDRVVRCVTALRDDPQLLVRRARAGLDALAAAPLVDGRYAAVGYCFGGMAVLQLARAGTPLAGVVSVHGTLQTATPARPGALAAKVLVCHGADDPHVPFDQVAGFSAEMARAHADWQLIVYGGAQHGFTHRHAVPGAVPGVAYDEAADRRSFTAIGGFLAEVFAR